jgi:subtilisin family serine protease
VQAFCLKVAGATGRFDFTTAQNAIEAGIRNNIRLFNLSLIGPFSEMLRDDLARAERRNSVLLIVAAGNDGDDLDSAGSAHQSFRDDNGAGLPNVIFVAALRDDGALASFSNYGKHLVQIAAPGVGIVSTVHPTGYGALSGTSQAAPFVTLAAAIIKAEKPDIAPAGIKNRILATCDWDYDLTDVVANGCRLNLLKAIVSRTDLVELQADGALLRGDVEASQFGAPDDADPVARVWLGSAERAVIVHKSGRQEERSFEGKRIAVLLHQGESCPSTGRAALCSLSVADIKDVVFRLR